MNALKPCPFCGEGGPVREENGEIKGLEAGALDATTFAGKCHTCNTRGPRVDIDEVAASDHDTDLSGDAICRWRQIGARLALERWNDRPE